MDLDTLLALFGFTATNLVSVRYLYDTQTMFNYVLTHVIYRFTDTTERKNNSVLYSTLITLFVYIFKLSKEFVYRDHDRTPVHNEIRITHIPLKAYLPIILPTRLIVDVSEPNKFSNKTNLWINLR